MCKLYLPVLAVVVTFQSCSPAKDLDDTISSGKWIDLSYDLSAQTLYWPNNPTNFKLDTTAEGITPGGFYYSTNAFSAPEHGGTHLDAPIHFAQHGLTVDKVDVDRLTGDAVVIDVSANALANRDYLVSTGDIANWEKKYGAIKENSIVLFKTGYGQFYPDAAKYFGTAEKGASAIPKLHFPGIDPTAATWLVQHKVKAVGIDTPSIDYGQSKDFKTHQILLGAGICGFENIANINLLPATKAYIVALPMKIKNGTGGPLRIIAWVKG
ncbi:MAG TPA: cyclase family protein [Panacibacter sp.]|nr:cyclase family protein [Panacibacter sp.]HNP46831.1 cyclase family protein [Panacibacter sp.]